MDPAAEPDATGATPPFSTLPYERSTSSRSRFVYFAATPFGYLSRSAWVCSIVHLRFLSSPTTRWKSPERDLSAFAPSPRLTPPSRMSCRSSAGRLASSAAPLRRALALGALGVVVWAANAALSSSGSHRRPGVLDDARRLHGEAPARPLGFRRKVRRAGHTIGLADDAGVLISADCNANGVAERLRWPSGQRLSE